MPKGGAQHGAAVANGGAHPHPTQPRMLPPPLLPAAAAGAPEQAAPEQAAPDARSPVAEGHCAGVHALALCAGHLCSAGSDATIRVWDPAMLALRRCACARPAFFLTISEAPSVWKRICMTDGAADEVELPTAPTYIPFCAAHEGR